jgi:hypothetical protein
MFSWLKRVLPGAEKPVVGMGAALPVPSRWTIPGDELELRDGIFAGVINLFGRDTTFFWDDVPKPRFLPDNTRPKPPTLAAALSVDTLPRITILG